MSRTKLRGGALPQKIAPPRRPRNIAEPKPFAHRSTPSTVPSLFWDIVAGLGFLTMMVFVLAIVWALVVCIVAVAG